MRKVYDKFGLLPDGDALAARQGRADDVLVAATVSYLTTLKYGQGNAFWKGVLIMMKSIILLFSIMLLLVYRILFKNRFCYSFNGYIYFVGSQKTEVSLKT